MSDVSKHVGTKSGNAPRTGLVYDDRMALHSCWWDSGHIERPERYLSSLQRLKDYDLIKRCIVLSSRMATEDELLLVHSEKYVDDIKNSKLLNNIDELEKLSSTYDSVYFNPLTYDCALLAAGCTLELVSAVLKDTVTNGLALVRPPGHHAMTREACGFCFFNNVAIATKYALENFNLKRILIVDWDVHHGQATQRMFYDDPRVLYFSIHRYQSGEFWPHLRESQFDFVGGQSACGFNINVPVNSTGLENADYIAIFNNVLLPIAYEFSPELILISAGYDAAIGCPEGEMRVSPQAYPHFLNSLSCLASGHVCVVLEGGYCLSSLSESVALTLKGLLGDPCPSISPCIGLNKFVVKSILNVLTLQRPFWDAVKLQSVFSDGSHHHLKIKYAGNPYEGTTVYDTRATYPVLPAHTVNESEAVIKELIEKTDLSAPRYHTGCIFVPKTFYSTCELDNHPETAHHVVTFYKKLLSSGLLSRCVSLKSIKTFELDILPNDQYLHEIQSLLELPPEVEKELENELPSVCPCQKNCSLIISHDNLLQLTNAVVTKICRNGFAVIRPTDHYPDAKNTLKYCTLSSVIIATKYLIAHHKMDKILIINLNTQSGNATQDIFYEDNRVLYVSLFPYNGKSSVNQIGGDHGKGYNINIPFNHSVTDGDCLAALFHIILPIAYEFSPQFILVSFGTIDFMEHKRLSPSCFGVIIKLLSSLCNGKIIVISEGGFCSEDLPEVAAHCLSSLLGETCVPLRPMKPTAEGVEAIRNVARVLESCWQCLVFDVEVPQVSNLHVETVLYDPNPLPTMNEELVKRRLSSNPVDIPKQQDVEMTILMDINREETMGGTIFCVTPIEHCPHLELLQPIPNEGLNLCAPCLACNDYSENWVCLHCYQVYCGRFVNQHMIQHGEDMKHFLTLSYSDLSVWCYGCDAYIHNNLLMPIKEHAHDKKFNLV